MPEPLSRDFHLGDILSVITGCLVSPNRVDGLYDILNWVTQDNLFTNQLPRASEECAPVLVEQHPDLASVMVPEDFADESAVWAWLAEQVATYGETRPVTPAPDRHIKIHPVTEMQMMRPDAEILTVTTPSEPGTSPELRRVQEGRRHV